MGDKQPELTFSDDNAANRDSLEKLAAWAASNGMLPIAAAFAQAAGLYAIAASINGLVPPE